MANGLAFSASTCKMPHPNKQYTVEVKHCPTLPENMRHWQVYGSDKEIESLFQSKDEYEEYTIYLECEVEN